MSKLVSAYVIYDGTNNHYVGDQNTTIVINCERLNAFSPRKVWLKRFLAPGDGTTTIYEPTFDATDIDIDSNTVIGYWVEQDGKDVILDIADPATGQPDNLQVACDACCDSTPTIVTRRYTSGIPTFAPLTIGTYCIFRIDDGDTPAHEQIALDYLTQIVGPVLMRSHISNTSHYTVQAFRAPKAFGSDTITSGACSS